MAELKISSNVRINDEFKSKIERDLQKIEELSPANAHLKVVLKRVEANQFETEMETIGFHKTLFSKARASNAFVAFKKSRDHLIKQIKRYRDRQRSKRTEAVTPYLAENSKDGAFQDSVNEMENVQS